MHLYEYQVNNPIFNMRPVGTTSVRSRYEVDFRTPRSTGWPEGDSAYGDYFTPQNVRRAPLAILVHGFGDQSVAPCLTMARLLVRQGVAAFVLYLPFHSRRLPDSMKGILIPPSPIGWFQAYESSVAEIRHIIDWASHREEIDPQKIIVAGISLGGMVSSIAMALDKRILAGIFITIGGNMEELATVGRLNGFTSGHSCTPEECHSIYSRYPAYLAEVAEKGLDNVTPAKECFLYDPFTFVRQLRGRPVLMFNATDDEMVSRYSTLSLWEAYGKPSLIWLPGSHAEAYSRSTAIVDKLINFVNSIKTQ